MAAPVFSSMQRLLDLGRPHRGLLGLAFGCMALVGLTTGAYAFLMGPALRYLLTGGASGLGLAGELLPLERLDPADARLVLPLAVLVIGAVKGVGYLGQFYWVGLFGQKVVLDLRRRVFEKLLTLSPRQRATQLSGELLSRFTADVAAVEQAATYTVASWLRDSLQIVILVGVAVWVSWKLALLALVAVPLAVWPATRLTAALLRRTREGQAALGGLAGQVQEGLGALRTLQAYSAEQREAERFGRRAADIERALSRAGWARAGVPGLMEIFASAAIAATLAWAVTTRAVPPDALVSFLGALVLVYQPAKDLGRVSQFAVTAGAALERLEALLGLPVPVKEGVGALAPVRRAVEVEALRFGWDARPALDGVTLRFEVGTVTALVGESGSGKSTLAALLLRLEEPQGGAVRFDGVDAATATLASVRGQFALVTQEALLFSATVAENLRLVRPGATAAELEAALRTAFAWDFVAALPKGLDTPLGERGVTLSGGQKQRLCLARAVLAGAPVLLLDEATSSLDPESEREVQRALEGVLAGRTAIVIAHRLETVRSAQRIVVLGAGKVLEQGPHDELLRAGGAYAQLWQRQHG